MKAVLILFVLGVTIASEVPLLSENVESSLQEKRNVAEESGIYDADIFRELRDLLKDNDDAENFKTKVEELFGKESELAKSLIDALRDDGRIYVLNFFNRLIGDEVTYSDERFPENADFNFLDIFKNLKQLIKEKVDVDKLNDQIDKLFGKSSEVAEQLINFLTEKGKKGKDKILELIDQILDDKERKRRSINEIYAKIKDYFKDLNIELKEKFTKFGEYVKDQYQKVLDKSKTKAENIKEIAQEFLKDGRKISKEIAEEALEFFREYKEDLGRVYNDLVAKVRDITKKKDS